MASAGKMRNAFALLQEESSILRRKEKQQRALARKIREEANVVAAEKKVPVKAITLQQGLSWADISDDDEDDGFEEPKEIPDTIEAYLSSSEEEEEEDEEEDVQQENESKRSDTASEGASSLKEGNESQTVKILTKKERNIKELDEFDRLLNDLGLETSNSSVSKSVVNDESERIVPTTSVAEVPSSTKAKKKKKKATTTESEINNENNHIEDELSVVLSREEALAAAKKAATGVGKKKTKASIPIVPATVLAEAKKKTEAKKSKQKKDKYLFERQ